MRNDLPRGPVVSTAWDELDMMFLKTIACLLAVVGSLVSVGVGIGYLIWG